MANLNRVRISLIAVEAIPASLIGLFIMRPVARMSAPRL